MTPGRQAAIEAAAKALAKCVEVDPGEDWGRVKPSFREQAFAEAEAAIDAYERVLAEQPQDERLAEAAAGLAERRSAG